MSSIYFCAKYAYRSISSTTINFLFIFLALSMASLAQDTGPNTQKSTFTSDLINLESAVNEVFRYTTTLQNNSGDAQIYELETKLPKGWNAVFRSRGKQLTSIKVDGGKKETLNFELVPSHNAEPTKYKINVTAKSENETIPLNLEAVVRGSYELSISTPTGRLSDKITEGNRKEIQLTVKNTATLDLKDISLTSKTPPKWSVVFEPSTIENLSPGETENIIATVSVPDKTIAGDYMTTFTAKNANVSDEAVFRMAVVTSWTSGILGSIIILIAIALVYFLIRKFGRR